MKLRIKVVYIGYALVILVVVLSGTISYMLLRNILGSENPQPSSPTPQLDEPSPHPTREFGIPLPGASTEVVNTFWQDITAKAVKTNTVDLTNCIPDPQIAGLTLNQTVNLTNRSESPIALRVSDKVTLTIPENGSIDTTADFGHGYGVYDLYCNGSEEPIGVFVVENP